MNSLSHYRELGKIASARRALKYNAGNAHEFAAQVTAHEADDIGKGGRQVGQALANLQRMTRTSLYDLLDLTDDDRAKACAAFAAGCFEWLEANPD